MQDQPSAAPPATIEGFVIGLRLREAGALLVHGGRNRLDLPIEAFFARVGSLTGGFDADDFLAGVRRAATVHHEALLPFVTGGRCDGFVFAVAKSVEGPTLHDVLEKDGPLSERRALGLAAAVAGALAALERAGMRHGDLSPRRVIQPAPGAFVVGPPRIMPASLSPRDERWQAPEEARGGENGIQSDLFVLGLVLVAALSGSDPLAGAGDARRALRDWKTIDLATILRGVSAQTRSVVAKLLAAEPANRYPVAAEAVRAISEAASSQADAAPIGSPVPVAAQRAGVEPPKRAPGRLYVDARLGEALIEIDDECLWLGPGDAKNVRAQSESFPEATIRVERAPGADVVHAVSGEMRINGRPAASHQLADGDRIEAAGIVARYERTTRSALRSSRAAGEAAQAAPSNPLAGLVTAVAVLVTAAALGWGAWRVMGASKAAHDAKSIATRAESALADHKREFVPDPAAAPGTRATPRDHAAMEAYGRAAQVARRQKREARAAYWDVFQKYGDTAFGLLARLEVVEIDRHARPAPDTALNELLVAADSAGGALDEDTLRKLRDYVEEHAGTLSGERAHVALVRTQMVLRGRLDADLAAVRAAQAKKDWREALVLLRKIMDYVPRSYLDEVIAERRKIEEGQKETMKESPGGAPGPQGGKPKDGAAGQGSEVDRNRKAEEAFQAARRLMDGGNKEAEALDALLAFVHDFKDVPNGAKYDPEARGRINTLVGGPAGVSKLFRGKAAFEKDRWKVRYDFEDPRQLEDFRDLAAFDSPPRAVWKIDAGAVKCSKGSGALVLDAVFEPKEVSASVVVATDRPHDIGAIFVDPSEQRRFYLFTLQNTFFNLGKGEGTKAFNENAVVLFGPNMWKDTPAGQMGFVRKCGSAEPSVRPSESIPIKAGKSGAEVWMRFEGGRSIRGSAYGDKPYDFPGVTPGLFVIGSPGVFDEFVVEGNPDKDWIQKRWQAILARL